MTRLAVAFEKILSKHLETGETHQEHNALVVAYSGGLDSTCLLLLARQFGLDHGVMVRAIHVNHQLSDNAAQWQHHCEGICTGLNIPFDVKTVLIDNNGESLEAAARQQRYNAIAQATLPSDLILLGQHKEDQAETLLLQLLRGAGPQGLSAMAEYYVNQYGCRLLRPLLDFSKAELRDYVVSAGIRWVEDESNDDKQYDRNFLRHEILPLLSERWPGAVSALARSVRHIQCHEQLLQQQVAQKYAALVIDGAQLNIPLLRQLSSDWQALVIKFWVKQRGHSQPSESVLQRVISDCLYCKVDAQPVVAWGGWQCCRFNDALFLFPQTDALTFDSVVITAANTQLPGGLGTIYFSDQKPENVHQALASFRLPRHTRASIEFDGYGRKFKPIGAAQSKPLKQWFKLWNIPVWQRRRTPILVVDGNILAVGNHITHRKNQNDDGSVSAYYYSWSH